MKLDLQFGKYFKRIAVFIRGGGNRRVDAHPAVLRESAEKDRHRDELLLERLNELVPLSKELNDIFFGAGLPAIR